jgi:Sigma-54 interaction domain
VILTTLCLDEIGELPLEVQAKLLRAIQHNEFERLGSSSETWWHIEGKDGAAAILGLHPSTLRARMHKLRIVRPETKEPD